MEDYQPYKSMIEEIDASLKAEHSTVQLDEDGRDLSSIVA